MYYESRWEERELFAEQSELPRQPSFWQICLVLLVGPTLMATITVLVAIHIEHLDVYLSYLGG
jgi:hypothetical protein